MKISNTNSNSKKFTQEKSSQNFTIHNKNSVIVLKPKTNKIVKDITFKEHYDNNLNVVRQMDTLKTEFNKKGKLNCVKDIFYSYFWD